VNPTFRFVSSSTMSRASASDRATPIPRVAFSLINFDQSDWRGRAIPAGGCGNRFSRARARKEVRAAGAPMPSQGPPAD
jgi:hypothetical protein